MAATVWSWRREGRCGGERWLSGARCAEVIDGSKEERGERDREDEYKRLLRPITVRLAIAGAARVAGVAGVPVRIRIITVLFVVSPRASHERDGDEHEDGDDYDPREQVRASRERSARVSAKRARERRHPGHDQGGDHGDDARELLARTALPSGSAWRGDHRHFSQERDGGPLFFCSRPARFRASRSRNSMCPLSERRSSFAHRWTASSSSRSARMRNDLRSFTVRGEGFWLSMGAGCRSGVERAGID